MACPKRARKGPEKGRMRNAREETRLKRTKKYAAGVADEGNKADGHFSTDQLLS